MNLVTPVNIKPSAHQLDHKTPVLLIGSCFADNLGQRLTEWGFQVLCNPFGVMYNPLSVAECLTRILWNQEVNESSLVLHEGLWHNWLFHGSFSHSDKEECLTRCNQAIHQAHQFIQLQPWIIITLGTSYCYYLDSPTGGILSPTLVANCHKVPAQRFTRTRLGVEEIVQSLTSIWDTLQTKSSHLIATVSPIRHMADTAHGNQLSKATLLLALDQLMQRGGEYFPSYEILLDELRDYRFFDRDFCHPAPLSVDIICERFAQCYIPPATQQLCQQYQRDYRRQQHRPLHPIN